MAQFMAFLLVLLGAAPRVQVPADEQIRQANASFERGDLDAAARLYGAAEERTGDPGLVAFNRAAVLFAKGEFRAAELEYRRVLDDPDCPPERRARAWFNRGTTLLRRGGDVAVYRSAISCFDRAIAEPGAEEILKQDAKHNLELAKFRWAEERKKASKTTKADSKTPEEEEPRRPTPPKVNEQGSKKPQEEPGANPGSTPQAKSQSTPAPGATNSQPTEQKTPGAGNLEPLLDRNQPQALNEADARAYLQQTMDRLKREQQSLLRTLYGPNRPEVRDW